MREISVNIAPECSIGIPFVTSVIVDPDDHRIVWAGVEIDGIFRSLDCGDTWTHVETGLYDPDIHAVTISAMQPKRLYASTAREVFTSSKLGETRQPLGIREKWPLPYARGIVVKADDPGVLFAGCGETATGEKGHVLRTTNFGETWEILPLPTQPMPLFGALLRIPLTPTALWRSASSVRCTSVRMPARPGERSRANSARSGPSLAAKLIFISRSRMKA